MVLDWGRQRPRGCKRSKCRGSHTQKDCSAYGPLHVRGKAGAHSRKAGPQIAGCASIMHHELAGPNGGSIGCQFPTPSQIELPVHMPCTTAWLMQGGQGEHRGNRSTKNAGPGKARPTDGLEGARRRKNARPPTSYRASEDPRLRQWRHKSGATAT